MFAFAPNGSRIIGTYERIMARAEITLDSFAKDSHGHLNFDYDYAGGSEVFWDTQETMRAKNGQIIFLAEDGEEYTADQITLSAYEDGEDLANAPYDEDHDRDWPTGGQSAGELAHSQAEAMKLKR